jgi:pilus assembly protein CpaE
MWRSNVLVVTKDEKTAETVDSALSTSRRMTFGDVLSDLGVLAGRLRQEEVPAVVVDVDADPSRMLKELDPIIDRHPHVRFVAVCSKVTKKLIFEAMQSGARHFLSKESISEELTATLEKLVLESAGRTASAGSIVTLLSASGGCGATTVAFNLANELRLASSEPVLAIDLDCHYGAMSSYLGVTARYGVADALSHKGLIDRNLISSSASAYKENFHVLVSPVVTNHTSSDSMAYGKLPDLLHACRQAYRFTIIDAPRMREQVVLELAEMSRVVLIVFQLTVKDIKTARSMIATLVGSRIPRGKILPVVNRFARWGPLVRPEDGTRALGLESYHGIRSDFRNAVSCLNHGQPLAQIAPKCAMRRDFMKLAGIVGAHDGNEMNSV